MIKKRYLIFIITLIVLVNFLCSHTVYADWLTDAAQDIVNGAQDILNGTQGNGNQGGDLLDNLDDYKPGNIGQEEEFTKKVGVILGVLNIVGLIISVVTIMLIGFKYMLGSVEEKASYKKVMIPWLVGAILVFTVTTVPNVLYNIGTSLSSDEKGTSSGGGKGSGTGIESRPSDIIFETELLY